MCTRSHVHTPAHAGPPPSTASSCPSPLSPSYAAPRHRRRYQAYQHYLQHLHSPHATSSTPPAAAPSPMSLSPENFLSGDETASYLRICNPSQVACDPWVVPALSGRADPSSTNQDARDGGRHSNSRYKGPNGDDNTFSLGDITPRTDPGTRALPRVIQGRTRIPSPPLSRPPRNLADSHAPLPPPSTAIHDTRPRYLSKQPTSTSITLPSSLSSPSQHRSIPQNSSPPKGLSTAASFSSSLIAKSNVANANANTTETSDDVMDIEACIDDPILAPLGRHVNKRKSYKRTDNGHIDIKVVRPSSPSTFIQEQERESHMPVSSLVLRRRRFDLAQLEDYLQNLLPTLDPLTMTTLQSPLLYLTELDLSRNRLSSLPKDMTGLVPFLNYINLSHNQFTEIPLELCRLANLQVLLMSQNRIEGPVPHQICSSLAQLKTLKLCANQITSLPHTLARLDKLESLSMGSVYGGNLLTAFPANCIQHMSALRELDLSHNQLCLLPADIGHPTSHLRQLIASDNKLEAIPKSIGLCRELRSLNLGRNQLTSLPAEIADLKQLDTLDLSENLLCVIPGDVADFLTKTTLLLTGNPFTRGYCDAGRNPMSDISGLSIKCPSDEDRYAAILKSLSRRAILNYAASSSGSGTHTPTLSSFAGRESPRLMAAGENGYEMDQDERLDYQLSYTRHALSSRPPSRADSISSVNDAGDYGSSYGGYWTDPYGLGTGASTPTVNVEAVLADIDSFFDGLPTLPSRANTTMTTTISSGAMTAEPSIFESTSLSAPLLAAPTSPALTSTLTPMATPEALSPSIVQGAGHVGVVVTPSQDIGTEKISMASPLTNGCPMAVPTPNFFPSLRELVARMVLYTGKPVPTEVIPETVLDYLQPGARPCGTCRKPYVKEWVSSVRVKSYLGHPAVARRVRFCSVPCWKAANEQLDAEESGMATPVTASPGSTTGQLPPIVHKSISQEDDSNMSGLESGPPSPTRLMESLTLSQQAPLSQGMKVCKGGQTYWPVVVHQIRERTSASRTPLPAASASALQLADSADSIAKEGVCAKGCRGGGVCEW